MDQTISRRNIVRLTVAAGIGTGARVEIAASSSAKLSVIADDAGHELPYAWQPATATAPTEARTLVILHGHGTHDTPSAPSAPGWNVLVPLDTYGPEGKGSWWLGEGGDFFVFRLLQTLVRQQRAAIGGDAGLYFYGSSMGGYGALLHGMLMSADGVFANAFQSKLRGTAFTDAMAAYIGPIGIPADSPYGDLTRYARAKTDLPLFFLDFNRFDHPEVAYVAEHFVPFVSDLCANPNANVHAEVYPVSGHAQVRPFAEMLALFDRYR